MSVRGFVKLVAAFLLCVGVVMPRQSFAQPSVRVLLVDSRYSRIPEKDEKVEQIGSAKGDVILNGMKYSGDLQIWKSDRGLYIINEIALEDYVKGVVASEVGSQWAEEALKAQAVAARTYALYELLNNETSAMRYHLTSTVLHQAYRGSGIPPSIAKAVDETKGEVLMYDGSPILAFYHSTSGGRTEDPLEVFGKSYPYLKSIETHCELSPYYMWEKRISAAAIEKAMSVTGLKDIAIGSYTVSKRVKVFKLITETGEIPVPGRVLRQNVGWDELPSTLITSLSRDGSTYIFDGQGYGHGVGLCQWCALEMANEGKNYRDILAAFYPGTMLEIYEDR